MADFLRNYNPKPVLSNPTNGFFRNRPHNLAVTGGYVNLTANVTINSVTVSPTLRLLGSTPNAAPWVPETGASNFVETSTGTNSPAYQQAGAYGNGVKLTNNQKGFQSAVQTGYGVGTDDFLMEWVFKYNPAVDYEYLWYKSATVNIIHYVDLDTKAAKRLLFQFRNGATLINAYTSAALTAGNTYYLAWFGNRDEASTNGSLGYLNNANVLTADISPLAGADMSAGAGHMERLGGSSVSTYVWNDCIYYMAIYRRAAWFAAGAQCRTDANAFVSSRYTALTT